MMKFFILLSLVATCQPSNTSVGSGSSFSGPTSTSANSTTGLMSNVTSTTRMTDVLSNIASSRTNVAATGLMTTVSSWNRSLVTSAIAAAQTALNNVVSGATSALNSQESNAGPLTVANIVSSAESAVISAITGMPGSSMTLSDAISNAVTSAASSSNFLSRIINIVTRMTTIFTTFVTNAGSSNIITALQESFSSGLKTIRLSVKSVNPH